MSPRLVEVALPLPMRVAFTYSLPEDLPTPAAGVRVMVPFGARRVIGLAIGEPEKPPTGGLKDVLQVLDEAPLVGPALLELAGWVSRHYLAPPGECYRLLLPPAGVRASRAVVRLAQDPPGSADPLVAALREGPLKVSTLAARLGRDPSAQISRLRRAGVVEVEQSLRAAGFRLRRVVVLVESEAEVRGTAQAAVLDRLRDSSGTVALAELVAERSSLRGAVKRLAERGVVRLEEERMTRSPDVLPGEVATPLEPSDEQEQALGPILQAVEEPRFEPFLLHGVTASGKTEVYFRAIERALGAGRGGLVLVPEIALTPLLVRAAAARFGGSVAVMHSELSVGERHDQWWRIRDGEARVVVGARSAVFAPVAELGLIVVDEEHEAAYKQEETPRYHARDVAVYRARLEGVPVILGSATPAVESHANALAGKYRRLGLSSRIGPSGLPRVEVVDRRAALRSGDDPILTAPLRERLKERLERREQSLLLLNRRGYATSLLCRECGLLASCPNCSVSLTLHRQGHSAQCHYCGHQARTPRRCSGCKGEYLKLQGHGTERVVESVAQALPEARVERLDRDQAQRRGAVAEVLTRFEAGEIDILVGTQMIAKGHDFPNVTLVGVVDADVGLGLPDFRAAERSFQLLTQVAGRAGRGDVSGEVLLQTHIPEHYALRFACAQDYLAFFEREIEFRRTMGYPPTCALINLVLRTRDASKGGEEIQALAQRLRELAGRGFRVLGPALAPLARLKQDHRFQVLLKGQRAAMREALETTLVERYGQTRWPGIMVDIDPVSVM